MWYPVKLAKEAGGVHETLKLPGSRSGCSTVRSLGWSAAVESNVRLYYYPSCIALQVFHLMTTSSS